MSLSHRDNMDEDIRSFGGGVPRIHQLPPKELVDPCPNFRGVDFARDLHETLPNEIVLHILSFLGRQTLSILIRVNKSWCPALLASHNILWEALFEWTLADMPSKEWLRDGIGGWPLIRPAEISRDELLEKIRGCHGSGFAETEIDEPGSYFARMRVVCHLMFRNRPGPRVMADPFECIRDAMIGRKKDVSLSSLVSHVEKTGFTGEKPLKLVVVGDGAVGKTSLLIRISEDKFDARYTPTVFDNDTVNGCIDNAPFSVNMWDTAGEEDYDRLRPLSYPGTDVFLLCYSCTNHNSFINLKEKWYPEIMHHCPTAALLVCATKIDLRENETTLERMRKRGEKLMTTEEGVTLSREFRSNFYVETSAKGGLIDHVLYVALAAQWAKTSGVGSQSRCGVM